MVKDIEHISTFFTAILQQIDTRIPNCQGLILTSRETAIQVQHVVTKLGQFKEIQSYICIGGTNTDPRTDARKLLSNQPLHIIIGTPGRVKDMIKRKALLTDQIKVLILQKHWMFSELTFRDQIMPIVEYLQNKTAIFFMPYVIPTVLIYVTENREKPKLFRSLFRYGRRRTSICNKMRQLYDHVSQEIWKLGDLIVCFQELLLYQLFEWMGTCVDISHILLMFVDLLNQVDPKIRNFQVSILTPTSKSVVEILYIITQVLRILVEVDQNKLICQLLEIIKPEYHLTVEFESQFFFALSLRDIKNVVLDRNYCVGQFSIDEKIKKNLPNHVNIIWNSCIMTPNIIEGILAYFRIQNNLIGKGEYINPCGNLFLKWSNFCEDNPAECLMVENISKRKKRFLLKKAAENASTDRVTSFSMDLSHRIDTINYKYLLPDRKFSCKVQNVINKFVRLN